MTEAPALTSHTILLDEAVILKEGISRMTHLNVPSHRVASRD
jgi:hypothetical protein